MEKILTIKDKILAFLSERGIKKADFFEATGIQSSNFKGKNMGSQPGGDMLVKILSLYPELSADWLLRDKGEMLVSGFSPDKENGEIFSENDEISSDDPPKDLAIPARNPQEGIPLIPFSAMAGALTGEQTAFEYECERYVVPAFKGADFLMPIKGVSMQPTYLSGDIVACQRVPMTSIFFQWNKPYVLDTAQGPLVKRIKPGSDKQHVTIVSDNPDYDPFELPVSEIRAVALVIGLIRLE